MIELYQSRHVGTENRQIISPGTSIHQAYRLLLPIIRNCIEFGEGGLETAVIGNPGGDSKVFHSLNRSEGRSLVTTNLILVAKQITGVLSSSSLSPFLSWSTCPPVWSSEGDDSHHKNDEVTLQLTSVWLCAVYLEDFPLPTEEQVNGIQPQPPCPMLCVCDWISSAPHVVPRVTHPHYCAFYRICPWCCPSATEHFKHSTDEKDWKLLNHFEKRVLCDVLYGNCIGLFLYLTPSISPACSVVLQSACGFHCEIQCCDVLIE